MRLSPFFPHGGIPAPFADGLTGRSVEGVWQALEVFRDTDADLPRLGIATMRGLKRTVRRYGPVQGHRTGPSGEPAAPAVPLPHAALPRSYIGGRRPSEEEPPGEEAGPTAGPEPGESTRTR
ncbi:DUF6939 family protein [Streptomyces radiopugnans]|uniref:Uncharacterized protein n=1 Tax=Streptomyces radiopugnans TaxID=403935 RepID=A0A1H9E1A1_9ACTN|nr:hypothetical protein [Streptomyces radiopugnans]SEQ19372.1 hypothetical protein SAMN05216481_104391 [Streptomyces radiopugnans]